MMYRAAVSCASCVGALVISVPQACAQLRLTAPLERAAGIRLPLTVDGAPAGTPVVIERRGVKRWHAVRTLTAGPGGSAAASLPTKAGTRVRWRLRAVLADGTHSAAVAVLLRAVTLRAVGDINLGDGPGAVMAARGPRWPWTQVAPLLRAADIAFGNLECSVSDRGEPVAKTFTFRGRPAWLSTLAGFAGLDVVNLANNHVGDYGVLATADTVRNVRRAGLLGVGAGLDIADAATPRVIERLGLDVAFVGFSDIGPESFMAGAERPGTRWATLANIRRDVRAARRQGDVVIATFHWGIERSAEPTARQRAFAHAALAAGADAVIAAHPHVLQPIRRPARHQAIAYSLGNFVWSASAPATARTGILKLELSPRGIESTAFRPARIVATRPTPMWNPRAAPPRASSQPRRAADARRVRIHGAKPRGEP